MGAFNSLSWCQGLSKVSLIIPVPHSCRKSHASKLCMNSNPLGPCPFPCKVNRACVPRHSEGESKHGLDVHLCICRVLVIAARSNHIQCAVRDGFQGRRTLCVYFVQHVVDNQPHKEGGMLLRIEICTSNTSMSFRHSRHHGRAI